MPPYPDLDPFFSQIYNTSQIQPASSFFSAIQQIAGTDRQKIIIFVKEYHQIFELNRKRKTFLSKL